MHLGVLLAGFEGHRCLAVAVECSPTLFEANELLSLSVHSSFPVILDTVMIIMMSIIIVQ